MKKDTVDSENLPEFKMIARVIIYLIANYTELAMEMAQMSQPAIITRGRRTMMWAIVAPILAYIGIFICLYPVQNLAYAF